MAPGINGQPRMVNFIELKGVDQNARNPPVQENFFLNCLQSCSFRRCGETIHQTVSIFLGGGASGILERQADMTIQLHMVQFSMAQTPHSTCTWLSQHSTFTDPTALHLGVASCNPLHHPKAGVGWELRKGFMILRQNRYYAII